MSNDFMEIRVLIPPGAPDERSLLEKIIYEGRFAVTSECEWMRPDGAVLEIAPVPPPPQKWTG